MTETDQKKENYGEITVNYGAELRCANYGGITVP